MNGTVDIDEILADTFAYLAAASIEATEDPSMEAVELAHTLLAYGGVDETSLEYSLILSTIYSLAKMGYLNVILELSK